MSQVVESHVQKICRKELTRPTAASNRIHRLAASGGAAGRLVPGGRSLGGGVIRLLLVLGGRGQVLGRSWLEQHQFGKAFIKQRALKSNTSQQL